MEYFPGSAAGIWKVLESSAKNEMFKFQNLNVSKFQTSVKFHFGSQPFREKVLEKSAVRRETNGI